MDGLSFVNDLRLRSGYGVTGIAPDNSYQSLTSYSYGTQRFLYNGQWVQPLAPTRNPNPDLRWEEKAEVNVGANFALFDSRLTGAVDVYRRETRLRPTRLEADSSPPTSENCCAAGWPAWTFGRAPMAATRSASAA